MNQIRVILLISMGLFFNAVWAVDLEMAWDPVDGAAGYAVEHSVDVGMTWEGGQNVPNTVTDDDDGGKSVRYVYTGCPEDTIVVLRVMSISAEGHNFVRTWSGVWYDHRLAPIEPPGGTGIP